MIHIAIKSDGGLSKRGNSNILKNYTNYKYIFKKLTQMLLSSYNVFVSL